MCFVAKTVYSKGNPSNLEKRNRGWRAATKNETTTTGRLRLATKKRGVGFTSTAFFVSGATINVAVTTFFRIRTLPMPNPLSMGSYDLYRLTAQRHTNKGDGEYNLKKTKVYCLIVMEQVACFLWRLAVYSYTNMVMEPLLNIVGQLENWLLAVKVNTPRLGRGLRDVRPVGVAASQFVGMLSPPRRMCLEATSLFSVGFGQALGGVPAVLVNFLWRLPH